MWDEPIAKEEKEIGLSIERPLTVSQLNGVVKVTLEQSLPKVWVAGEITDLSRPSSGHIYFSLKDQASQIRGVIWRNVASRISFKLEDGMAVLAQGGVEVYAPRGTYQLIVQKLEPQGIGALQLALRQLHEKLAKEGLFEASRKRPLPRFPKRIGFVTSPSGAALKDFLEVIRRRWQGVTVVVIPARVQGEGSAEEIVRGIELAQKLSPPLDVLVVGRGGGSLEDLWSFNEEKVVRKLAASKIPTVSAVGHEIDVTLCDLAADVRALTPSEAAERVVPSQIEIESGLEQRANRLKLSIKQLGTSLRRRLEDLANRPVLRRPHDMIKVRMQALDQLEMRAHRAMWNRWRMNEAKLQRIAVGLQALSPLGVLARGYSVTQNQQKSELIKQVTDVSVGDQIVTTLSDGAEIRSRIEEIDPPATTNNRLEAGRS